MTSSVASILIPLSTAASAQSPAADASLPASGSAVFTDQLDQVLHVPFQSDPAPEVSQAAAQKPTDEALPLIQSFAVFAGGVDDPSAAEATEPSSGQLPQVEVQIAAAEPIPAVLLPLPVCEGIHTGGNCVSKAEYTQPSATSDVAAASNEGADGPDSLEVRPTTAEGHAETPAADQHGPSSADPASTIHRPLLATLELLTSLISGDVTDTLVTVHRRGAAAVDSALQGLTEETEFPSFFAGDGAAVKGIPVEFVEFDEGTTPVAGGERPVESDVVVEADSGPHAVAQSTAADRSIPRFQGLIASYLVRVAEYLSDSGDGGDDAALETSSTVVSTAPAQESAGAEGSSPFYGIELPLLQSVASVDSTSQTSSAELTRTTVVTTTDAAPGITTDIVSDAPASPSTPLSQPTESNAAAVAAGAAPIVAAGSRLGSGAAEVSESPAAADPLVTVPDTIATVSQQSELPGSGVETFAATGTIRLSDGTELAAELEIISGGPVVTQPTARVVPYADVEPNPEQQLQPAVEPVSRPVGEPVTAAAAVLPASADPVADAAAATRVAPGIVTAEPRPGDAANRPPANPTVRPAAPSADVAPVVGQTQAQPQTQTSTQTQPQTSAQAPVAAGAESASLPLTGSISDPTEEPTETFPLPAPRTAESAFVPADGETVEQHDRVRSAGSSHEQPQEPESAVATGQPTLKSGQPQDEAIVVEPAALELSGMSTGREIPGVSMTSSSPAAAVEQAAPISLPVTGQIAGAVARELRLMNDVSAPVRQLSVRLDPPELGALRIQVRTTADGLQMHVEAAEDVTLEMLASRVPEIEQLLKHQDVEFSRVTIQRMESEAGSSSGFDRSDNGQTEQQLSSDMGQHSQSAQDDRQREHTVSTEVGSNGNSGRRQRRGIRA